MIKLFGGKLIRRKTRLVEFVLKAPDAQAVFLIGDFNNWDPTGIPMQKDRGGVWRTKIKLCAGKYEYKFLVDNDWWTDPSNDTVSENTFGSVNSVKKVVI